MHATEPAPKARRLKTRRLSLFAAFCLVLGGSLPAGAADPTAVATDPPPTLDQWVRMALDNNADLHAMRHALQAARHRVPQAGALPDPMAGVAFSNFPLDSLSPDDTPMTGIEVRFSQRFPWPGKRALRTEVAEQGVGVAEASVEEASDRLKARVKEVYHQIWFQDRALEITRENLALLREFVKIAEEKYAVGRGVQADVTRAQVALSRLLDREISFKAKGASLRGRMNALLARPAEAEIRVPTRLARRKLVHEEAELQEIATVNRDALSRLDRMILQAGSRVDLARKELRPDISTGLAYRWRDSIPMDPVGGEDFVSASVMVNLPIWARRKQKEKIAENEAELRRLRAMREDLRLNIFGGIRDLYVTLGGLDEEIALYESGILIQTEQSLESSRYAYEVDKVDFLSLLDAQVRLLEEEIHYYRALSEYQTTLAMLEAEVGAELGVTVGAMERDGVNP